MARKQKYGEHTINITFRVPVSKADWFRSEGNKLLAAMVGKIALTGNSIEMRQEIPPMYNAGMGRMEPVPGFKPVITIRRSFANWMELKNDCSDIDEWKQLAAQIQQADNLTTKEKNLLLNR